MICCMYDTTLKCTWYQGTHYTLLKNADVAHLNFNFNNNKQTVQRIYSTSYDAKGCFIMPVSRISTATDRQLNSRPLVGLSPR